MWIPSASELHQVPVQGCEDVVHDNAAIGHQMQIQLGSLSVQIIGIG